jgi:hypothetical protein
LVEFDEPSNGWEVGEKRRCRLEVGEISPEEVVNGSNMVEEEI